MLTLLTAQTCVAAVWLILFRCYAELDYYFDTACLSAA